MKEDARTQKTGKTLKTQRTGLELAQCQPEGLHPPHLSSLSSRSPASSLSSPFPPSPPALAERLALSALQHLLYCPRQCALIHVERLWSENWHTAQGRIMHDRSDTPEDVLEYGIRVARAMKVWSDTLGLYGVCDVVEWRDGVPTPVEYKRGKPKQHRADEVQLCAQAMCLEEMFNARIPRADLFYGKTRRRMEVTLDRELRELTGELAVRLHQLVETGVTPPAEYNHKKCSACSLLEQCLPKISDSGSVMDYIESEIL